MGIPVVGHARQEIQSYKIRQYRLERLDMVLAVSKQVRRSLQEGGVVSGRARTIYSGLYLAGVSPQESGADVRARPEKILYVFQRIHHRFFRACGLASGRTSLASSRTAMLDRLLVRWVIQILQNSAQRAEFVEAGRRRAANLFTVDSMMTRLMSAYDIDFRRHVAASQRVSS